MTDQYILPRYAINNADEINFILSDDGDWVKYNDHVSALYYAVKKIEAEKREAVMQSLSSMGEAHDAYVAQIDAEKQRDSAITEAVLLRSILRSAVDSMSGEAMPSWVVRAQVALREAER